MAKKTTIAVGSHVRAIISPSLQIVGEVTSTAHGVITVRGLTKTDSSGETPCDPNDFYGVPEKSINVIDAG